MVADLRQVLSQGRKRIGLLVGAGGPLAIRIDNDRRLDPFGSPLIPGVEALTSSVIKALPQPQATIVQNIIKELGPTANIETILSRVRLLQQALGTSKVGDLDSAGYGSLGQQICHEIGKLVSVNLPEDPCGYNEMVAWIGGAIRSHAIEIFTTNYDLLFEEAFAAARAPYFDGFTGGGMPFFDPVSVSTGDLPPRWTRLWKLHGSLGWELKNGNVIRTGSPSSSELVYPDHLKYDLTQKQPYSALFERLKNFLLTPDTLLIACGFSFRDAHICAVIDEALAANANAAIIALQYGTLEKEEPAVALSMARPNFSVYAADGAVISAVKGPWQLLTPPKNWIDIRESFWGKRAGQDEELFLLGDFTYFARFCALMQATEFVSSKAADKVAAETSEGANGTA